MAKSKKKYLDIAVRQTVKLSNKDKFNKQYDKWLGLINCALKKIIIEKDTPEKSIYQAMNYSLMAGGKRIRPVLSLAVYDMFQGNIEDIMPYACSIELIHTYSLIHDDLPSMDDDDYRRGKLTSHKVYGEAKALLAGDALLTYAFEILTENVIKNIKNVNKLNSHIRAINFIAKASGASGMIGGQVVDLESENRSISGEILEYMHLHKTGAIIKAAVLVPAIIIGLDVKDLAYLDTYSQKIGLAFQIKDDILDIEGNKELLGKNLKKDVSQKKSTFVTIYGIEKAKMMLEDVTKEAVDALDTFENKAEFLRSLAYYIKERER